MSQIIPAFDRFLCQDLYWETDVYIFVYVDGVINIAYFNKLVGIKLLNNS